MHRYLRKKCRSIPCEPWLLLLPQRPIRSSTKPCSGGKRVADDRSTRKASGSGLFELLPISRHSSPSQACLAGRTTVHRRAFGLPDASAVMSPIDIKSGGLEAASFHVNGKRNMKMSYCVQTARATVLAPASQDNTSITAMKSNEPTQLHKRKKNPVKSPTTTRVGAVKRRRTSPLQWKMRKWRDTYNRGPPQKNNP